MTEWTLSHESAAQHATAVHLLHNDVSGALRHVGQGLWYVTAGRFGEAAWELWWAWLVPNMPEELEDVQAVAAE